MYYTAVCKQHEWWTCLRAHHGCTALQSFQYVVAARGFSHSLGVRLNLEQKFFSGPSPKMLAANFTSGQWSVIPSLWHTGTTQVGHALGSDEKQQHNAMASRNPDGMEWRWEDMRGAGSSRGGTKARASRIGRSTRRQSAVVPGPRWRRGSGAGTSAGGGACGGAAACWRRGDERWASLPAAVVILVAAAGGCRIGLGSR
jgi:hypothetical protein